MTIPKFLEKLSALGLEWEETGFGLRAGKDNDVAGEYYCPISAVAREPHGVGHAARLGRELGLSAQDTDAIIIAADRSSTHDPELRQQLLKATRLA